MTAGLQHNLVVGAEFVKWDFRYVFDNGTTPSAPLDRISPVYGGFPTAFAPFFADHTRADIAATYVQDQITLHRNVKLLGGARFDHVDQKSTDPLDNDQETNNRTINNVAPRVGLLVNPARSTSLYASYTNSFLPQYGVSRTGDRFDSQQGRQFEVGAKQNLLGDRLFVTLALYTLSKTNVPTTDPEDPRFSILTGEQHSEGIELEASGKVTRQWSMIANYAYTDAHISEDNRLRVGSKLVGIPKHSAGVWTTYDLDRGALAGLTLGDGVYAATERQARLPNVATVIPSYLKLDAFVGYCARQWSIQLNLKNLTNEKWYEAQGSNVVPQASRNALISLGYQFR